MTTRFDVFKYVGERAMSSPYKIVETNMTSDGLRSRLCNGAWATYEAAKEDKERRDANPS